MCDFWPMITYSPVPVGPDVQRVVYEQWIIHLFIIPISSLVCNFSQFLSNRIKVCAQAKWSTKAEIVPVSLA